MLAGLPHSIIQWCQDSRAWPEMQMAVGNLLDSLDSFWNNNETLSESRPLDKHCRHPLDPLWPLAAGSPTVTAPSMLRDSLHISLVEETGTRPGEMMVQSLRPVHEGVGRRVPTLRVPNWIGGSTEFLPSFPTAVSAVGLSEGNAIPFKPSHVPTKWLEPLPLETTQKKRSHGSCVQPSGAS